MVDMRRIAVDENVRVLMKVDGNLHLTSWEEAEVGVVAHKENLKIRAVDEDSSLRITCYGDCAINIPKTMDVSVDRVGGDAYMKDLDGRLSVQKVGGDLWVQRVPWVLIERIGGDCMLQEISESLIVERVSGSLKGLDICGGVNAETVRGDIMMQEVDGDLNLRASGGITVSLNALLDKNVNLVSRGAVALYVPADAQAEVFVTSSGRMIRTELNGESELTELKHHSIMLDGGGAKVNIKASGEVFVSDEDKQLDELTEEIQELEEYWAESEEGVRFGRSGGGLRSGMRASHRRDEKARRAARRIEERARRRARKAASKLRVHIHDEEELGRIGEDVGRQVKDAMRDAGQALKEARIELGDMEIRLGRKRRPIPPVPPMPPIEHGGGGATSEERGMILQMLQDGKIDADQAVQLLEALSGRK